MPLSARSVLLALPLAGLGCKPAGECGGFCGPGTHCESGRCVPDLPDEPEAVVPADDDGKKKKKRRRGRKGKHGADDEGGGDGLGEPLAVDDSRVPNYNPNRTETIGEGTERLPDREVRSHLRRLESKFNRCIEQASLSTNDEIKGTVDFTIGIEPSGKVWGVTAKAPAIMKKHGVVACLRVAIHKYRFPKWDGPSMGVDYSFDVG